MHVLEGSLILHAMSLSKSAKKQLEFKANAQAREELNMSPRGRLKPDMAERVKERAKPLYQTVRRVALAFGQPGQCPDAANTPRSVLQMLIKAMADKAVERRRKASARARAARTAQAEPQEEPQEQPQEESQAEPKDPPQAGPQTGPQPKVPKYTVKVNVCVLGLGHSNSNFSCVMKGRSSCVII
ncbi:hypothetical protein EBS40_08025 [bacterium]|nr:hypothetical protein [bacterium]